MSKKNSLECKQARRVARQEHTDLQAKKRAFKMKLAEVDLTSLLVPPSEESEDETETSP